MRAKRTKTAKKYIGKDYEHLVSNIKIMQSERSEQGEFVQFRDLQKMDDNKKIAVNSNYIYWALVKMARQKKHQNVLNLKQQINKIDDERQLYISMPVKEIKKCFTPIYKDIPDHMFKKI